MIQVIYFRGKSHVEEDSTQNYLVFQRMYRYFLKIGNTDYISERKSKGLPDKVIKLPSASNNSITPGLSYIGTKTRVKFSGNCLKQVKITFTHGTIANIYILYELSFSSHRYDDYPTLENW